MKTMKKTSVKRNSVKAKPKAQMGMMTKKTSMAKKGVIVKKTMKKAEDGMEVDSADSARPPRGKIRMKKKGFGKGSVPKFKVKMKKGKQCTSAGCR